MNKKILLLIIVIVLAVGGYFLSRRSNKSEVSGGDNYVNQPLAGKIVINMTDDGFSPSTVNIKQGETVVFKNNGIRDHWPASAIHPTHQVYPEFDPKRPIVPGNYWSFTFDKKGIWRYHDHLNPTFFGTINVE